MIYSEVKTDYVSEENGHRYCYVDVWETAEYDEEGHSVAMVNLDNGDITWTDMSAIRNPQVILAIAEIIKTHRINIFK